mmetsp:Transcript_48843/g.156207  ORF Transcript_48843/g.156207 Transcript_48843/m.156207 type:complete len:450 (+) Transcript_48843:19-1368(+)
MAPPPRAAAPALAVLACRAYSAAALLLREGGAGTPPPYRQRLDNLLNTQYHGAVDVGGQRVRAVLDTGSFELLVASAQCENCVNPPYDPNASSTFQPAANASDTVVHTFGSGPTESLRGYERVEIGPLVASNQTFFQIVEHNITAMNDHRSFNAIVGIGPESINSTEDSLLRNLNITEFSVCLEREPLAPGWLTWGGGLSAAQKRQSVELRVVGRRHWAVSMRHLLPAMQLSAAQRAAAGTLLCERGCAAILDSGTSLISAPSHSLQGLELLLPKLHENCSNFEELPDLELELDGRRISLPPEAYVMRITGAFLNALSVWKRLHIKPELTAVGQCFYGFTRLDAHTDYGPLWVLGMPFFRFFHVTFGLAPRIEDRRIWLAEAGADCGPLALRAEGAGGAERSDALYRGPGVYPKVIVAQRSTRRHTSGPRQPLEVDASELRLPAFSGGL